MDSFHPHIVLSKLNEQRSQGLFCDVIIVVEDVKFRAHKNILAACSSYFKNALTTETWSSSQVLELLDLKSEVFACVLNFIYSSKVTSPCADNNRELVAAGKKLGISFLAKLAEQERQDKTQNVPECVRSTKWSTATVRKHAREEATRLEEIDGARGPRITNAFSITEVCPGNNPFTPVEEGRQSPDEGQLPASCPASSSLIGINETTHTFSEHSYALNQVTEEKGQTSQWVSKVSKSATLEPKQPTYQNTGPLKKRHRLQGTFRNILPTPSEPHAEKKNTLTPTLAEGAALAPPLFPQADKNKPTDAVIPLANGHVQMDSNPRTLSPHMEDSISIYGCEHCPEIFTNEALLAIHSEVHKKCSVSYLFCKFCDKKFIHLKRLRNHEQNCPKAMRGKAELECSDIAVTEVDLHSGSVLREENIRTHLFSVDKPTTGPVLPDQLDSPKAENVKRPGSSQRRYHCSVCKRVYVTLSSLKRHENVHSWQRAYPCHYCNKVFALAEYRTKHEIWHTGERRYQCIFCLETFMTYYILKNHQKSFHGIDPTLSIKRKSANGGLKASVYPIKLYRLLPMKFRKRRYKTYSQTYSEGDEKDYQAPLESNPLSPQLEGSSHHDGVPLPLTFMATTTMVAPFMPRISVDKPCETGIQPTLYQNHHQKDTDKDVEHESSPFMNFDSAVPLQLDPETSPADNNTLDAIKSHHISQNVTFLNSLNTVDKLSELSASAKSVEKMTKEMLQSSTEKLRLDKTAGAKTETYIAKPVCPGPSADGDAMPLCQITVKIGDEAIIRRRIKGSKLFPRRKKKIRKLEGVESDSQVHSTGDNLESPRLRLRPEITGIMSETYDDPNECDMADKPWRPYYSYKSKKKRKKLKFKHRQALFHHYSDTVRTDPSASEARLDSFQTGDSILGGSGDVKRFNRSCSPRTNYNCDICDSSFITETGLRAHIIGSHPYFCRTCGKQGPPGETPGGNDYICNSCMENGSCFDNSPRSPNPEKKFRCSFCPQRFLYLATKRSHEKKHQETEGEGYTIRPCPEYLDNSSEDNNQNCIKTENDDNQESPDMKYEEKGHFPIIKAKTEDTTELIALTHQDMTCPHSKRSLPSHTEPLFTLPPSKMKHKMKKHSFHRDSNQESKRKTLIGQLGSKKSK
ncbi:zinc finger and BTB domain-containing protein 38 [Dunckerocampus dactyliophorus]|uniref:zinc finger and BTB domain-containing protein 38 n=1 Tax=Dunckerocampus dactyliophorus TaxID=161453 RepID=UPI0024065F3A|nr:zinc finger and BTB domain-containing protein 38 [Dunckerocampus dactyliophorus]XP_054649234.1 zinc finger and BTB domain-containing protein 38 [Dunckerocampus dactyliophorus]